ncbi:MAG: cobalt ECF transporter T component CbiQ [Candidatus Omnitrophica bacterium]|nr:cobalt ECF transporter T component CbiQ [Candidatus Omnitrophota bacterium]
MRHAFLDEHSRRDSLLHRRDPRAKILAFVLLILCIALTPAYRFRTFGMYAFFLAGLVFASGIPPLYAVRKSLTLVPFVLFAAFFLPFSRRGIVALSIPGGLCVTYTGLLTFWGVVVKGYLSIVSMILLVNTTEFPDLLKGFEQLKIPRLFITIISFMYRYVFVIEDELEKMTAAKRSRTIRPGLRLETRTLSNMVGMLFIRSYERAEAVYAAMCCRGYSGRIHTLHDFSLTKVDRYFLGFFLVIVVTIAHSGA